MNEELGHPEHEDASEGEGSPPSAEEMEEKVDDLLRRIEEMERTLAESEDEGENET